MVNKCKFLCTIRSTTQWSHSLFCFVLNFSLFLVYSDRSRCERERSYEGFDCDGRVEPLVCIVECIAIRRIEYTMGFPFGRRIHSTWKTANFCRFIERPLIARPSLLLSMSKKTSKYLRILPLLPLSLDIKKKKKLNKPIIPAYLF